MTNRVDVSNVTLDDARRELCKRLVDSIRGGENGLQIRFLREGESATEAWIYTKRDHEWKKRDDLAISTSLVASMHELMDGLAAQEFADPWTCRHTDHSDRIDFELKFRHESIEPHVKADLESYLNGCLSHGQHDSGKDSRRRIRFQRK